MKLLAKSRWIVILAAMVLVCLLAQQGLVANKVTITYFQDWFVFREKFNPNMDEDLLEPLDLGYFHAIKGWLDKHPNVELKFVDFDCWTQTVVNTAIATGTIPSYYCGNVPGGWLYPGMRKSFRDGYAADITALVKKYGCDKHEAASLIPELKKTCLVDGKWYGISSGGGFNGMAYRKDIFKKAGLINPDTGQGGFKYNWTPQEFRQILKKLTRDTNGDGKNDVYGWAVGPPHAANIFGLTGMQTFDDLWVPTPGKPWKWRLRLDNPIFLQGAQLLYDMIHKDKTILVNTNGIDEFKGGRAAMFNGNQGFGVDTSKYKDLLKSLGARGSGSDIIGWMPFTSGAGGMVHTFPFVMIHSFNPRSTKEELDASFDLCEYMLHGEGWTDIRLTIWEQTESAYKSWDSIIPYNGVEKIPGIPTARFDAYDKEIAGAVKYCINRKNQPDVAEFFPSDNDAPGWEALSDFCSKIWNIENLDVKKAALEANKLYDQQAAGYKSKFSNAEYVKHARAYYSALLAFYQKNCPGYYQAYLPWYQKVIAPTLK